MATENPHAAALATAAEHARVYLNEIDVRPVGPPTNVDALRRTLGGPLPREGTAATDVVDSLARGIAPGLVASPGPRYFGFVTGGALPAAVAADWLTAVWDQNVAFGVMSPGAAIVEEIVAEWTLDVLGLPSTASVGFVTGAQMANITCLAAARHHVLAAHGWDVAGRGLNGAPAIRVVAGDETHVTLLAALRLLGMGAPTLVASDHQGRMDPSALADALALGDGPLIVCAQAGNVNTGAVDPLDAIADLCGAPDAWLHVDGAFGLWAAASLTLRHLTAGAERADSWATDGHKWLNVPYDSGIAVVAHPSSHRAAMALTAAYLTADDTIRNGSDWAPEASRRARAIALWAAYRSLGRNGIAELVDRCCALARRMATNLAAQPGVHVLNDVVINQVLVRFDHPTGGDGDAVTVAVIRQVQDDGVCWAGGTSWHGHHAMRISVSNWSTTEDDIDTSAHAILDAARRVVPV